MAKATLDDVLKELKKQTRLLEKIEKATRKQRDIGEVADKVAGVFLESMDSVLEAEVAE